MLLKDVRPSKGKSSRQKKTRILCLCLSVLILVTGVSFAVLEYQSVKNAYYSVQALPKRNFILNCYDAAKGLVAYRRISKQFDAYEEGSIEKLQAMVEYVYNNIKPQYEGPNRPIDDSYYNVLRRGYGYCDQMAQAFNAIALMQGYEVHSLALFNVETQKSPHTVSEIYYNGKWAVVDPWTNTVFMENSELVTREDIVNNPEILNKYSYVLGTNVFEGAYPFYPFPLLEHGIWAKIRENFSKIITGNKRTSTLEKRNEAPTREEEPAQGGKPKQEKEKEKKVPYKQLKSYNQARLLQINGQPDKAYACYDKLIRQDLPEDMYLACRYQMVRYVYETGKDDDAIEQALLFLSEFPDSEWDNAIKGILSQLYIKTGKYEDAIQLLSDMKTNPATQILNKLKND